MRKLVDTDVLRPMGRIVLSGRPTPIIVWGRRRTSSRKCAGSWPENVTQFDTGDKEALHAIEAIAAIPTMSLCLFRAPAVAGRSWRSFRIRGEVA